MKRIDVENAITKYLTSNPIYIKDILLNRYSINSYEQYISYFALISNTYKNTITEFVEESKRYTEIMNTFIHKALTEYTDDNIDQSINGDFLRKIDFNNYNREKELICIYPKSFLIQRECSQEAFINIYEELGFEKLQDYIQLVKDPSRFSSYMDTPNKQILAMKFLLYKTDHHSSSRFKRDLSSKTIFQTNAENMQESISVITNVKDDFIHYMDEQKEAYSNWFNNTSTKLDEFTSNHETELSNIERTYEAKLKIEEPAKFMLEQSEKYKNSFYLWTLATVILAILLLVLLALIISPQISFSDKLITINVLSKDVPVYSSIILLAMISLVVYILRIFIKMAISSKHLMEEYKQKYSLTYFYLSLVNNGNIKDEKSQNIILTSLFTKADTGLIKNDNSNELDKTLLSLLTK